MEEIDQEGLLETLEGYPVGERVILGHFSTVQTLLALIFNCPVTVFLQSQQTNVKTHGGTHFEDMKEPEGMVIRTVNLYAGTRMICVAVSRIPKIRNRPEIIDDVCAGGLGLGQIAFKHNLPVRRRLISVQRSYLNFGRHYVIEGEGLFMEIDETFDRQEFMNVGWV